MLKGDESALDGAGGMVHLGARTAVVREGKWLDA